MLAIGRGGGEAASSHGELVDADAVAEAFGGLVGLEQVADFVVADVEGWVAEAEEVAQGDLGDEEEAKGQAGAEE